MLTYNLTLRLMWVCVGHCSILESKISWNRSFQALQQKALPESFGQLSALQRFLAFESSSSWNMTFSSSYHENETIIRYILKRRNSSRNIFFKRSLVKADVGAPQVGQGNVLCTSLYLFHSQLIGTILRFVLGLQPPAAGPELFCPASQVDDAEVWCGILKHFETFGDYIFLINYTYNIRILITRLYYITNINILFRYAGILYRMNSCLYLQRPKLSLFHRHTRDLVQILRRSLPESFGSLRSLQKRGSLDGGIGGTRKQIWNQGFWMIYRYFVDGPMWAFAHLHIYDRTIHNILQWGLAVICCY